MYDNNDVQLMLDAVNNNTFCSTAFNKVLEDNLKVYKSIGYRDYRAINNCIEDGCYEAFDSYDSDVCERFIRCFERVMKPGFCSWLGFYEDHSQKALKHFQKTNLEDIPFSDLFDWVKENKALFEDYKELISGSKTTTDDFTDSNLREL